MIRNMKYLAFILMAIPSFAFAEDVQPKYNADVGSSLSGACLTDKSNLEICRQAHQTIKQYEKRLLNFVKEQGFEEVGGVVAFSLNTIKTQRVEIPHVIPFVKADNRISISQNEVMLKLTVNWP